MTDDEKNYIASRYHDYKNAVKGGIENQLKAEAIKQLMDFFGIDELEESDET